MGCCKNNLELKIAQCEKDIEELTENFIQVVTELSNRIIELENKVNNT